MKPVIAAIIFFASNLFAISYADARPVGFTTGGLVTSATGDITVGTPFLLRVNVSEPSAYPDPSDPTPSLTFGLGDYAFTAPITYSIGTYTLLQGSTLPGLGDLSASFSISNRYLNSKSGLLAADLGGNSGMVSFSGTLNGVFSTATGNFVLGAVPEPATWAMMMAGLSAIGFAMRRRQNQSARVGFA